MLLVIFLCAASRKPIKSAVIAAANNAVGNAPAVLVKKVADRHKAGKRRVANVLVASGKADHKTSNNVRRHNQANGQDSQGAAVAIVVEAATRVVVSHARVVAEHRAVVNARVDKVGNAHKTLARSSSAGRHQPAGKVKNQKEIRHHKKT